MKTSHEASGGFNPWCNTYFWTKAWVVISVYLVCSGWILSELGCLNAQGYLVAFACGLLALFFAGPLKKGPLTLPWAKLRRRFRRFLPAFFLLLWAAAVIGGILYSPNNYDALSYRFPRILHWFAEGRWHWVPAMEDRLNISATGMEWLMCPLFALTHGDRLFFLINIFSFSLLPGLIYGTFIRLGISKRQAWVWMWLLPSGYGFACQAGSIGNDSVAAAYLLAALCLVLRFRETRRTGDFWVAMLAMALATGVKASNLPLLAPWGLAALPGIRLLKGKLLKTAAVAGVCVMVSFVPTAWLNFRNTGDWTGDPSNADLLKIEHPLYGILGNGLQCLSGNLMPPVMPWPQAWNRQMDVLLKSPPGEKLVLHYPRISLKWADLQNEENAGLGLGLFGLLCITAVAAPFYRRQVIPLTARRTGKLVALGTIVALAAFMAKLGSESAVRLIIPYYPLMVCLVLLLPGTAMLAHKRWWRAVAILAALSVLPIVVFTPSRPLWPAMTVLQKAVAVKETPLVRRGLEVYSAYAVRNDALAPLRKHLTPEDKAVGFFAGDASEVALWRPFGERRVVDIPVNGQQAFFRGNAVGIISRKIIQQYCHQTIEEWLAGTSGRVVAREMVLTKVSEGPQEWCVIRSGSLEPASSGESR